MSNQVSSNTTNTRTSGFDSNKLLSNGAISKRNGVKGPSIGRVVETDAENDYNINISAEAKALSSKAPSTQASTTSNKINATGQTESKKTAQDVLNMLKEKMPGWTISTTTAEWGAGFRNIQIDESILQRMADDPKEMERVMSIIREYENAVPQLEKWQEQNPGQSLILSLFLDPDGNITGLATIRTLLGDVNNTEIDFTGDRSTWLDNLHQIIEDLTQESKSWTA